MPALTTVTAAITGTGTIVMTSATGSYDIDDTHGVIHLSMGPPVTPQNGGPDSAHTYVIRGTEGAVQRAFVGTTYIGTTSTGMARYSYNFAR